MQIIRVFYFWYEITYSLPLIGSGFFLIDSGNFPFPIQSIEASSYSLIWCELASNLHDLVLTSRGIEHANNAFVPYKLNCLSENSCNTNILVFCISFFAIRLIDQSSNTCRNSLLLYVPYKATNTSYSEYFRKVPAFVRERRRNIKIQLHFTSCRFSYSIDSTFSAPPSIWHFLKTS